MLLIPYCDYWCMQAIKLIPKLFLSPLAEFKVPQSPDELHIGCHNASRHWQPPKQKWKHFCTEPQSCRAGNKIQVRFGWPIPSFLCVRPVLCGTSTSAWVCLLCMFLSNWSIGVNAVLLSKGYYVQSYCIHHVHGKSWVNGRGVSINHRKRPRSN